MLSRMLGRPAWWDDLPASVEEVAPMTLAEIREWYEANKTHTMYDGHWCRTCSIGALLSEIERLSEHTDVEWGEVSK